MFCHCLFVFPVDRLLKDIRLIKNYRCLRTSIFKSGDIEVILIISLALTNGFPLIFNEKIFFVFLVFRILHQHYLPLAIWILVSIVLRLVSIMDWLITFWSKSESSAVSKNFENHTKNTDNRHCGNDNDNGIPYVFCILNAKIWDHT